MKFTAVLLLAFQAAFAQSWVGFWPIHPQLQPLGYHQGVNDLYQRPYQPDWRESGVYHHHNHQEVYSQANELAHHVHEAAYHLQQIAHHEGGYVSHHLQGVVDHLNGVVQHLQQVVHHQPDQVHVHLKLQVQEVVEETHNLQQLLQQLHYQEHQHISEELEEIVDELLAAVQQLQVQSEVYSWSSREVQNHLQKVALGAAGAVKGITHENQQVVHQLIHHAHQYGHHVGQMVHELQHEIHHHQHQDQVEKILEEVADGLSAVQVNLEQVGHHSHHPHHHHYHHDDHDDASADDEFVQVKNVLADSVHGVLNHVQHLLDISHHGDHHVQGLVGRVVAHAWVITRQLQGHVEDLIH